MHIFQKQSDTREIGSKRRAECNHLSKVRDDTGAHIYRRRGGAIDPRERVVPPYDAEVAVYRKYVSSPWGAVPRLFSTLDARRGGGE
jgi:hypothetical protein